MTMFCEDPGPASPVDNNVEGYFLCKAAERILSAWLVPRFALHLREAGG
jgi:hypothetical protein